MGILTLREDRPTPKAVYNWRVYGCSMVASFAACMIGYDSAFIGTTLALPSFVSEFRIDTMTPDQKAAMSSTVVSVYQAGAIVGSLSAYTSTYFIGRKKSLLLYSLIFMLGAGMMLGANGQRGLGLIIGGRVLAGIAVGACSMVVPIYISELSPPAIRGRLVGIYELGWQMGGLVGFWINYGVNTTMAPSHAQWLIPFAVQLIPGGLLLLGCLFIKESPRWLFSKNKREQAMKNLCWIRNLEPSDLYIVEEVAAIEEELETYRREVGAGFFKPFTALKQPQVRWRFFLGSMLFLWQNGSGINAINYYSPTVFRSLGITGVNTGFLTTGIFGVIKTVLTFVWLLWLVDHLGRRKLLMIGAIGGSICMWYLGAYIAIAQPQNNTSGNLSGAGISAIVIFYIWTAFYSPSWNGTPWVLNSEMFDANTRSLGQASAAASNWLYNLAISLATPYMFLRMQYGVYFFFASLMILSVVFVFYLVPETKTVPLEAMDRLFAIRPIRNANKIVMDELRERDQEFRANADGAGLTNIKEKTDHVESA
ncbi:quinate permease [Microdochium trichocladiopsis]|uniref:Quinate transporter n=1 Tax=Microdochium trichocladiopsis TaxID=1682393 RepID=A0A9P8XV29_9PEZI|nr:quinate permease [Microdochium trichocladiopsis]KAH7014337.1 quinate permease [Microdochium trichocladiopsis]